MFSLLSLVVGAVLLFSSWFVFTKVSKSETLWKTIPRERKVGGVLAAIALSYSAFHGRYMLEGGLEPYRIYVWILLPIVTVMVYLFLDFVFTRSLGGVLIVMAVHLTHEAFIDHLAFRPLFSLNCYILGTVGLFLVGTPWRFRDLLDRVRNNSTFATGFSVYLLISGLIFTISPLF